MDGLNVTVGFTGIWFKNFWGFRPELYEERKTELEAWSLRHGINSHLSSGPFQNAEEAVLAARKLNEYADAVLLDVATFPEGKAAQAFAETLSIPCILWSRPETKHQTHLGHNSFCGANFINSNLALRGIQVRQIFGALDSPENTARLRTALRLIGAAKAVRGATIALLGEGIVPKFHDIDVTGQNREALKQRWGITYADVPVAHLLTTAKSLEHAEVTERMKSFSMVFHDSSRHDSEQLERLARLALAVRRLADHEGYAAAAVRCWPELQSMYGIYPCAAVAMLNQLGLPCACEGDPGGALDMLLLSQLMGSPSTLLDVVDWHDDRESMTIWHCGPTAPEWADEKGTRLVGHCVYGSKDDGGPAQGPLGNADMAFKAGPVTLLRTLGGLDDEFIIEGELVPPGERDITGSCGVVEQMQSYARPVTGAAVRHEIMSRRLPHHFTAVRGHLSRT